MHRAILFGFVCWLGAAGALCARSPIIFAGHLTERTIGNGTITRSVLAAYLVYQSDDPDSARVLTELPSGFTGGQKQFRILSAPYWSRSHGPFRGKLDSLTVATIAPATGEPKNVEFWSLRGMVGLPINSKSGFIPHAWGGQGRFVNVDAGSVARISEQQWSFTMHRSLTSASLKAGDTQAQAIDRVKQALIAAGFSEAAAPVD